MDLFHDTHNTTSARIAVSAASTPALRSAPVAMSLPQWGQTTADRTRGGVNAGEITALVTRCPRT